jgi:hypothetical protein
MMAFMTDFLPDLTRTLSATSAISTPSTISTTSAISASSTASPSKSRAETRHQSSLTYIHYMLRRYALANSVEDHIAILKRLFEFLIAHPSVLVYEPNLRTTITKHMTEIEGKLVEYEEQWKQHQYDGVIDMVKLSVRVHLPHHAIRKTILQRLEEVTELLHDYQTWLQETEMPLLLVTLRDTLTHLRNHPDYVPDE